jgi:hypothetical protein
MAPGGDVMKELFVGMLFVFLDVNIGSQNHILDVLPDFVGYLLMQRGLGKLSEEGRYFEKALPVVMGMTVYSVVLYVMDIMATTVHARFVSFCLGLAAMVCSLLIGFWIVSGVRDMERSRGWNLEGEKLHSMWLCSAVIQCIAYLCGWIPLVGQIGAVGAAVMHICFLVAFYQSENLYEAKK